MSLPERVRELISQLSLSDEVLRDISSKMLSQLRKGLEKEHSSVAMLPTFVPALPDGTETGKFVAMDLNGKNLRIMILDIPADRGEVRVVNQNFVVHTEFMRSTSDRLFNFIVNMLARVLEEQNLLEADLPVAFVFSYPCDAHSLRSARLLQWTKGFDVPESIGKDVVQLLEEALLRHGRIKVRVKAIMNDTVGQLASAAYTFGRDCVMGVVVNFGCNASYLEEVSRLPKFDPKKKNYPFKQMVVDTEWEELGSEGELDSILTQFDREIDSASVHKGKQMLDKLTGAFYIGDLVRRILDQLSVDGLVFGGQRSDVLAQEDSFPAKYISEILRDSEETQFQYIRRVMDELRIPLHAAADYVIVREVCQAVSVRSASLVAAAIAALLTHMGRPKIVIGVGGALVQFHPTYMSLLSEKLTVLAPTGTEWELKVAEDGSCRGAALVAAIAEKLNIS